MSSRKGSAYEREVCTMLSLWWTNQERDDVFWRTGGSGGRAKSRGRKGKETYGQSGDVTATDPIGDPLIKMFTIEIKRGYSRHTLQDMLDAPSDSSLQQIEKWIEQAMESAHQARSLSWLLIIKRDRRDPLVLIPTPVLEKLFAPKKWPVNYTDCALLYLSAISGRSISCLRLHSFLHLIKPNNVRYYATQD